MNSLILKSSIIALLLASFSSFVQAEPDQPTLSPAEKSQIVDSVLKELNDRYIFPDVAQKMETDIRSRIDNKEYDPINNGPALAEKLTADLQSISNDKHLRLHFSPQPIPVRVQNDEPTPEEKAERENHMKRINFAFERVERMPGNVGYIKLNNFFEPKLGEETVAAAMNFVANTDSLIFDLRENGGGDPEMIALITSYLFGDEPVHLNDLHWREGNRVEEFWTNPKVLGKKYGQTKDIYVLTSNHTFSGAEEFANNLKVLKRATIVGETTGGGANPGDDIRINDHFIAFIPTGRAVNPITKTNWEGVGVEPDVKTSKDRAMKTAYLAALNKSVGKIEDERLKNAIANLIEKTQKELDAM